MILVILRTLFADSVLGENRKTNLLVVLIRERRQTQTGRETGRETFDRDTNKPKKKKTHTPDRPSGWWRGGSVGSSSY